VQLDPRAVRRDAGRLPAMRLATDRARVRIRLNGLQGALSLHGVPGTVRLFQVHLNLREGTRMAPRFHELKVTEIARQTPEAVAVAFEIPDDLKDAFAFRPGQYLTLATDIDGKEARRS